LLERKWLFQIGYSQAEGGRNEEPKELCGTASAFASLGNVRPIFYQLPVGTGNIYSPLSAFLFSDGCDLFGNLQGRLESLFQLQMGLHKMRREGNSWEA